MSEQVLQSMPPLIDAGQARRAIRTVAAIALASIALGLLMQALILAGKLSVGSSLPGVQLYVDLAQGVAWSLLVCTGVGIATTVVRARPVIAGLVSLLLAPLALALAKSSQKVVASLLDASSSPAILSVGTISALKAAEYGLLGWLLAKLVQRDVSTPWAYLGTGAAIGLAFGGAITVLAYNVALAKGLEPTLPGMVGGAVNEVVFPMGCALVIFVGQLVSRNLSALSGPVLAR